MRKAITSAMVLAAGLGTRMRPLTEHTPKPLIKVLGKPLLDYTLDQLDPQRFCKVVVNMHYLADQIENFAGTYMRLALTLSDERIQLLDSGGGVKKALPLLGEQPFFVLNSDTFWLDAQQDHLQKMETLFFEKAADVVLLVVPHAQALGFNGVGDLFLESGNHVRFRGEQKNAPFIYCGVCLLKTELFANIDDDIFSLKKIFDLAQRKNTLYGLPLEGHWFHVGTPEAIPLCENKLKSLRYDPKTRLYDPH